MRLPADGGSACPRAKRPAALPSRPRAERRPAGPTRRFRMTREGGRLRATLVLLLLVSAALFAIGATVERHKHTEATPPTVETSTPTAGTSSEAGGEAQPTETHPAP